MPKIILQTEIKAPIERVFDLSRSIDLHKISVSETKEEAIAGRTSGLIELGETVTWRAKHFGVYHVLTSKITEYNQPYSFTDIQVKGIFKSFSHTHRFVEQGSGTVLHDVFEYQSPLGWLGKLADKLFLENYMKRFLITRNQVIKKYAESDLWKKVIIQP